VTTIARHHLANRPVPEIMFIDDGHHDRYFVTVTGLRHRPAAKNAAFPFPQKELIILDPRSA